MIRFFENDPYSPIQYVYDVDKILYKGRSEYQEIMVIENSYFGRILILDGVVQLTEKDEFFYHEMLVHVAMHSHPDPRKIAVIGGGDGGAVREIVKHDTVEKVFFVEIDREVINTSKKYFPTVSSEIDNARVEIHNMDGAEFVKNRKNELDLVIVDSTDIIGFAKSLFTVEFFRSIRDCLTDQGMFVTLSESLHFHRDMVVDVQETMRLVFPVVDLYTAPIATYAGNWWTFSAASMTLPIRDKRRTTVENTRFYSEDLHRQSFLPEGLYKKLLQKELDW
ncbi:spermidine synthase [bacterium BMS3Bbin06]|nr:spermidine synthase [bacterium BMS3Abin08]GBE34247.1 spermidine synthase [bacterium BMS3Bbin06]HDO35952.1 polyamine aminopropyltransferase [Nitrospirota bacterium]HDY71350.1 polyamine aminopropyltransferase [Nitrospirota bacterium]